MGPLRGGREDAAGVADELPAGHPGAPFVETVRLYEPDGSSREYHADRDGTVYEEWLLDASGREAARSECGEFGKAIEGRRGARDRQSI